MPDHTNEITALPLVLQAVSLTHPDSVSCDSVAHHLALLSPRPKQRDRSQTSSRPTWRDLVLPATIPGHNPAGFEHPRTILHGRSLPESPSSRSFSIPDAEFNIRLSQPPAHEQQRGRRNAPVAPDSNRPVRSATSRQPPTAAACCEATAPDRLRLRTYPPAPCSWSYTLASGSRKCRCCPVR